MPVPRPEYPRPHFDRSHSWLTANGEWDFVADPRLEFDLEAVRVAASRPIAVPFSWETAASGISEVWLTRGWYRRTLTVPAEWIGQRIVLHFGAVHHAATVWVNDTAVGEHVGGYLPFEFDITDAVRHSVAEVIVRVDAPADKRTIVHGKQRSIPRDDYDDCAFTPSSGIWQSVWLETRPATWIRAIRLRPSNDLTAIDVEVEAAGPNVAGSLLRLDVEEENVAAEIVLLNSAGHARLALGNSRIWRPDAPHLYRIRAGLRSLDGEDIVTAYTGLRRVTTSGPEIRLNGERLYVRGVLDQGYWSESGITAPTDDAFVADLQLARAAGFNVVRKHLKVEDPRFLYHADRLGMLVWAEPASTGRFDPDAVAAFEAQIGPMVERDGDHPSIVIWGLYNEEWGLDWDVPGDPAKQEAVRRAYRQLKALDPSRPVVDNSGWAHVETDLVDWHVYTSDPVNWRELVAGIADGSRREFPVHIAPDVVVQKQLMADAGSPPVVPNLNSEYAGGFTATQRGWHQRWQTQELRRHDGLSGYVYTELYDVEHEMAGVYSERRSRKDLGGADPALAHAVTTLVLDVDPLEPGRDVVADGQFEVPVHVSHHGLAPLTDTW
jgi:beta-galactosidase/beta-glucuronidase